MSVSILGGGLGGLSASYYHLTKFPSQAITLIESSNRLGGWIKSTILEGEVIFEQGPRTIRPFGQAATETLALVEKLGIDNEVTPIYSENPAAKNRMIYVNKKLHVLPNSFLSLFKRHEPFSKPLIRFLANDLLAPKKSVTDESINDFVTRRFGSEVADYLVGALICGICAGDSKQISVNFLMKKLFDYEQKYGNISKGLVSNVFNLKNREPETQSNLLLKAIKEKWNVYSFKNGLETLTKALESNIKSTNKVNFELGSKCTDIEVFPENVILQLEDGKNITSHHVISSLPAETLGSLLQKQHPELAESLQKIKAVTVAVVNVQYKKKLNIKEGFGILVPPKEKLPILGITFDSCCFPHGDNTVLTVMMGGPWFEQLFGKNPDESLLLKTATEQLKVILGVDEEPSVSKVTILEKCIPQYVVGHNENLTKINKYIKEHDLPIFLCGSSYYGVGINDVISSAKQAVNAI